MRVLVWSASGRISVAGLASVHGSRRSRGRCCTVQDRRTWWQTFILRRWSCTARTYGAVCPVARRNTAGRCPPVAAPIGQGCDLVAAAIHCAKVAGAHSVAVAVGAALLTGAIFRLIATTRSGAIEGVEIGAALAVNVLHDGVAGMAGQRDGRVGGVADMGAAQGGEWERDRSGGCHGGGRVVVVRWKLLMRAGHAALPSRGVAPLVVASDPRD